jgi:hypothetical protein
MRSDNNNTHEPSNIFGEDTEEVNSRLSLKPNIYVIDERIKNLMIRAEKLEARMRETESKVDVNKITLEHSNKILWMIAGIMASMFITFILKQFFFIG